ncbi:MAG: hypoxanthine-guanine phosphoribosyltransferase [Burkholderiales bacterium]|nr:hypoxanthine-guanine phosphoribosyltransferase [Burkholderiales bacterium]
MQLDYAKAKQILDNSTILYDAEHLYKEIERIASEIDQEIDQEIPVVFTIMNGGMMFSSELTKRLKNPIHMDYIHASRYGDAIYGSSHITWYRQPKESLIKGRIVYLIDDILDEGHTLAEIRRFVMNAGAKDCKIVVLVNKEIGKDKPVYADYVGVTAPNQFLFGFGMDIFEVNRNLQGLYIYNN